MGPVPTGYVTRAGGASSVSFWRLWPKTLGTGTKWGLNMGDLYEYRNDIDIDPPSNIQQTIPRGKYMINID